MFGGMHGLLHYVKEVLPRTLRLKHTILTDVAGRTNKYKEVRLWLCHMWAAHADHVSLIM